MAPLQISSSFSQSSRPPSHYARIFMVLFLVIILPLLIFSFLSEAANEKDLDYSKSLNGTTQKAERSPNFLRNKAVDKLPLYNPTEDEVKFGDDIDAAIHHGGLESDFNGVDGGTADSQNANHPVVDVITISAVDRIEHQRKQRETWASDEHFVRHVLLATEVNMDTSYFFGMNDGNDRGGKCSNLYFACAASQSNSSGSDNSGRDGLRDRFLEYVDLGYESRTENATNTAGNFGVNATNQMQPESSELQSEETAQSEEVGDQVVEAGETSDSLKSETFSEETNHLQLESLKAKELENDDFKGDLDTAAKDDNVAIETGNKETTEMETIAESERKLDPESNQAKDIKDEVESTSVSKLHDAAEVPDDNDEPLNEEEAYCMQRRIGFAMGASSRRYHKLVHATNMKNEHDSFESEMLHWKIFASKVLPEYLIVSFDTTFFNTELLVGCIDEEPSVYSPLVASSSYTVSGKSKGTKNEETFFYPQKHSGVVFNKSALEKWIRPIACFNNQDGSLSSTLEFKKTAIPIFHDPKLDELESEFCSFISSEGMAKNLLNTNKLDSVLLEALHLFRNLHEKTKLNLTNLTFSIGELMSIYSSQMHLLCDTLSNGEVVPTAEEMLGYLVHKFKITTSGNIRSFVSAEHETKSQIDEAPMKSSYASSCIASSSLSECDRVTHVACLGAID